MKKVSLIVLLVFAFSLCFADVTQPRLLFGSGNDKFTYGISKNEDDQLSYSGIIEFAFDRYKIDLNMKAYTDRGSWSDGEFRDGRLDEVSLSTYYQYNINLNDYLNVDINPTIGFGMIGKCYFDFVQNFNHKNLGVERVDIPYDWDKIEVKPIVGFDIGLNGKYKFLNFKLEADYLNTILFNSNKKAVFKVSAFDNLFSLGLGYQINKNFSDSLTIESVNKATDGLLVSLDIDAGVFVMDWQFYPDTGFGFGTYYIDVMPIFREGRSWKQTDVYLDHGLSKLYDMELLNACFRIPVNEKVSVVGEVGYVSGFPKTIMSEKRSQRNYALYEAGITYCPIKWYVSPYIQAQFGIGSFQVDYLDNANPVKTNQIVEFPAKYALTSDFRIGLNVFPEGFLAFGSTAYQIQLYAGTHFIPWTSNITQVLKQDLSHVEDFEAKRLSPYLGLGVSIGVNIPE